MSVHRETFAELVNTHGWTAGAELGVDKGILFGMLLRHCPALERLIGVDTFPDPERSRRVFELERNYLAAHVLRMSTVEAAESIQDGSLDFVFIDADHGYQAVMDDIAAWRSKVRAGGWLGGHDYCPKFAGVMKAVDRTFGRQVATWHGTIWGVWC